MHRQRQLQGLFVLAGIALVIVGFNSTRPLIIVGFILIFLSIYAGKIASKPQD